MSAMSTATEQRDHIDRFLDQIRDTLPGLDLEVEGLVDRISGLSRRIHRMLDETLEEFGLDHGQYKVLSSLVNGPDSCSPGFLSQQLDLSSGAMTNRLDRLERRGLVQRTPDPDDRRGVRIEATPEGRRLYKDAVAVQAQKEALVAAALNEREKQRLNALLRRLMLEFERREDKGRTIG